MKHVLIVSFYFPPPSSTGALRISKFAEQLPHRGYVPLVLTTNRYGESASDSAAYLFRAGDWIQAFFRPLRRSNSMPPEEQFRTPIIPNASWLGQVRDRLMVPDTKIGWFLPAVRLGRRLIEQYHPSAILSTSPPETSHLVAYHLSRWSGLPWVADLRDGWLFEPPQPHLREPRWRHAIEAQLERKVILGATAVTTVSAPLADDLSRRYPQAAERVHVITNGYDRAEFEGLARRRAEDGTWRLVHAGSLGSSRSGIVADAFFAGLALFKSRCPDQRVRVRFVGAAGPAEQAAARDAGVTDLVTFLPPVSRHHVHQELVDADAALLVTGRGPRSVATLKLFDYIGAGVPVLALAEDNAAAEIIRQYHLGITVAPDDPAAVARGLEELVDRRDKGFAWDGFNAAQGLFEWQDLTTQLAKVLDGG